MDHMKGFFSKTFSELTTPEPLEIHGLGDTPLDPEQLSVMFSVINHRFENLLPTTTYTDKNSRELCRAIESPGCEMLAYTIVGRLWEMGVERSEGIFAGTCVRQGFGGGLAVAGGTI